mmetsp:Transcript_3899/g.4506  ORF Transcript_3899/g.4506 Transcript_3899/m.4506 type:complete len:270 (+) Transcript_3899:95-904(+)
MILRQPRIALGQGALQHVFPLQGVLLPLTLSLDWLCCGSCRRRFLRPLPALEGDQTQDGPNHQAKDSKTNQSPDVPVIVLRIRVLKVETNVVAPTPLQQLAVLVHFGSTPLLVSIDSCVVFVVGAIVELPAAVLEGEDTLSVVCRLRRVRGVVAAFSLASCWLGIVTTNRCAIEAFRQVFIRGLVQLEVQRVPPACLVAFNFFPSEPTAPVGAFCLTQILAVLLLPAFLQVRAIRELVEVITTHFGTGHVGLVRSACYFAYHGAHSGHE